MPIVAILFFIENILSLVVEEAQSFVFPDEGFQFLAGFKFLSDIVGHGGEGDLAAAGVYFEFIDIVALVSHVALLPEV